MEGEDGDTHIDENEVSDVYLPGESINEDEQLVHDETSYVVYHEAQTGSPCLSFDIIQDELGDNRNGFPITSYVVCGTQSTQRPNHVIVMKMSNMHRTKERQDEEDSDSSDDEDEDLDSKPELETAMVLHHGGVNRIRNTKFGATNLAATWSERNSVHIWDLSKQLAAVDNAGMMQQFLRVDQKKSVPLYSFGGHLAEGFAMDWSPTAAGTLLTGDCRHHIHLWTPQESGTWHVDQRPFSAHTDSVEDVQWSPNERSVFASCSVDKTIRIWDTRASPSSACMLTRTAHEKDINVISWNKKEPFIVSGGDDAMLKVWDLRQFQKGDPVATFKHHTAAITSVEWHPNESSIFAAAGADNQVTQWDLAVEPDNQVAMECENNDSEQNNNNNEKLKDIPPQLLFIHQGQTEIKEIHWHPQIPGLIISTALSGFNVFKTISV
ncbi:glutamate-rich WD repeat-containing protein 1-like [Styela clava]